MRISGPLLWLTGSTKMEKYVQETITILCRLRPLVVGYYVEGITIIHLL